MANSSLRHVVTTMFMSEEFNLWAVTSWEQQRREGPEQEFCWRTAFTVALMVWFFRVTDRRWQWHVLCLLLWMEHLQFRSLHSLTFSTMTNTLWLYPASNAHKHISNCCWEKSYQSQDVCADGEQFRTPVTHRQMDKLGADESLFGRQPLKYSLKTFRA